MQNVQKKIQNLEMEHSNCSEALRRQISDLEFSAKREAQLKKELEVSAPPLSAACINISFVLLCLGFIARVAVND